MMVWSALGGHLDAVGRPVLHGQRQDHQPAPRLLAPPGVADHVGGGGQGAGLEFTDVPVCQQT